MDRDYTYEGIRLHCTVEGSGRPLMLLHGWGCDGKIFDSVRAFFVAHFCVYTFDFAGFGRSEEPREVWGVEQYTRSIEAFARENGLRRPILIGHSFGGRVAILYASRNDVEKVMLVDAAGVKPRRSARYYWKVYSYKIAKRLLPIAVGKPRAQRMIERYRAKTGSSDYNNATPMMRAILSKCVNEDLCHVMPQIKAPTLLFWGERDTATPVADARRMESLIPDAGVVIVKGGSHFSFLDNPDLFLRVAESFLVDHDAKDAAATAEPNKTE